MDRGLSSPEYINPHLEDWRSRQSLLEISHRYDLSATLQHTSSRTEH